jgi:hypothetical protein
VKNCIAQPPDANPKLSKITNKILKGVIPKKSLKKYPKISLLTNWLFIANDKGLLENPTDTVPSNPC